MKKGFTLIEVLVAVMIVTILITMAVPMYEKMVEKSRLAEVSVLLKKLGDSKLRTMDNMDITDYTDQFGIDHVDADVRNSKDFTYSLYPASFPNAVCAVRARGANAGTVFLYLGETAADYCTCPNTNTASICGAYCTDGRRLFCHNKHGTDSCAAYSMDSYATGDCN